LPTNAENFTKIGWIHLEKNGGESHKKYIYNAKIADFSKTGSRNMAETCAIDLSYPTYYSSSVVLEGLRGPLLPVLM